MKFLLILSIFALYSVSALPFNLNYLEKTFGPYNGLRFGPDARIVGGDAANITDYPYQGSLMRSLRHICGCNVISSRYVLTAAHCTDGASASSLSVRVGSSFQGRGGTVVNVAEIIQNPNYNAWNIDYDYSILRLEEDLTFSDEIKPIQIPCQGQNFPDGTDVCTTGWGNTQNISISSEQLRVACIKIINQLACINAYAKISAVVTDSGFLEEGGKDACQGDSGGPLASPHTDSFLADGRVLIGLVSWGYGCAKPNFPGVYSRLSAVSNWIMEKAGITSCHRINQQPYQLFQNPFLRDFKME